jgi:prolyl-tRNA editing enzyme YbaK/EbsC (Cys-tRNA(Pro) deacylase)
VPTLWRTLLSDTTPHPSPAAVPTRPEATDTPGTGTEHPSERPSITEFRSRLRAAGGRGEIVVLPESVHTAALAAAALGCEVGAIVKSLLFTSADNPVLVLTSGAHQVDTAKVADDLGLAELRRASPDFVRRHTGQVIGGVSPLGHPRPIPTHLDRALGSHPVLWAAASHPAAVFSTTYVELLAMTGATEIEVR